MKFIDQWPCIWKLAYFYLYYWRLDIVEVTWVVNDYNFSNMSRYDSHFHYILVVLRILLCLYVIRSRKKTLLLLFLSEHRFYFLSNLFAECHYKTINSCALPSRLILCKDIIINAKLVICVTMQDCTLQFPSTTILILGYLSHIG